MRFVVAAVGQGYAVGLESIAQRQRRMVQISRHDIDVVDAESTFDKIVVLNRRGKLGERDREIAVFHLACERGAQAV